MKKDIIHNPVQVSSQFACKNPLNASSQVPLFTQARSVDCLTFGELCASTCAQYTDATDRARQEGFRVGGVGLGGWIRGGGGGGEQTKRGRGEERSGVAVRGEEGTGRGEPLCRFISCKSAC